MENGRQTCLYLDENAQGITSGGSHPWEATFCIHMSAGTARPISEPGGTLIGAVCGIDPAIKADDPRLVSAGPLLQLQLRRLDADHGAARFPNRAGRGRRVDLMPPSKCAGPARPPEAGAGR